MRKLATDTMAMLLALVRCVGCDNRSTSFVDNLIRVDVMTDCPEKELILQDLMDVEYIVLETTDDFITEGVVRTIGKDIMLVTNQGSDGDILVFDRNEKELRRINRLGQSDEEYTQFTRFVLDEDNDEVFVKNNPARKVGAYDLLGNYKRSFRFTDTSYYNYIFNYNRDHLVYYKSYPSEKGRRECHLIISKQDGHITRGIQVPSEGIETPVITEGEFVITPEFYLTFLDRDKWILVNTSSDTMFHYLPDSNLSPLIVRGPPISSMDTEVFLFPTVITDRYCFMGTMRKEADSTTLKGFLGENLAYDKQGNALFSYILYSNDFVNKEEVFLTSGPRSPEIAICQTLDAPGLVEAYEKSQLKGKLKEITTNLDEELSPVVMLLKKKK